MKISEINIFPITPRDGLLGFCNFIYNDEFYMGGIGVYSRPEGGIRLTYPYKKGDHTNIPLYYPINKEVGDNILKKVEEKYQEVIEKAYLS